MNDKKMLIDAEYIEFDFNEQQTVGNNLIDLDENFAKKCNLNTAKSTAANTNDYKHHQDEQNEVEGDDEKTDEDEQNQSQLNLNNTPTTRRRRKSSGRSKLNKILQSASLSSSGTMTNNKSDSLNHTEDPVPASSSSTSLSSWIHLPNHLPNQQQEANFNQLSKNMTKNLNSSYDTISEEEHRAKIKKRNLRSIDDDIVSSNVSSADDLPCGVESFHTEQAKQLDNKLDKKSKQQQSCDSLSSSPTNVSYDSSSPIKSSNLANKLINGKLASNNQHNQNKENNHLLYNNLIANGKQTIHQNSKASTANNQSKLANGSTTTTNTTQLNNHHQCINCLNNNYITFEQQKIPWLYDSITREDAELFLNKFLNVDGVFLVRTSSKQPDNYVLSFVHDRRVKHCHIRKLDVDSTICYSIDSGKMLFYDVKQLVEFYQLNSYFLPTKLKYFLIHSSK